MLFLDEVRALAKIREIFALSREAKIAVAFWGRGAAQKLGLDRSGLEVEIICNLDSGACNPAEIESLKGLRPHFPVWSDPRLHGKLYWTPQGVVIGSSNASTNGLAVEDGLDGWAEANIFSSDQGLIDSSLTWFKNRKDNSYEITDADLRLAEEIWKQRSRHAPPGVQLLEDLGAVVRRSPKLTIWKKIKVAIYSEDLSLEAKTQMTRDKQNNLSLKGFHSYEDWRESIDAGDWILDFSLTGKNARFEGYWSVPDPKFEIGLLTYVQEKNCVLLPALGMLKLSASDRRDLEAVALLIAKSKDASRYPSAMISIGEAIAFIDNQKMRGTEAPDLEAFRGAMLDIFKEATKVGYRPTEFLRMVDRQGALPAAKRLIMGVTPSSGFTRLWQLKRLDLTVEALALKKPWRQLFTAIELQKATQRLEQLGYKLDS